MITGAVFALLFFATQVFANGNRHEEVKLCHKHGNGTFAYLVVDDDAVPGHLGHGDFYYQGNAQTQFGKNLWCNTHVPQPSPTPTATPTPTVEPEPEYCQDENATNYKEEGECEYEEDPTPTPTPTDQPTPTPEPERKVETQSSGGGGGASAPTCSDSKPGKVANIYVDPGKPNDGKLEVRWLPEEPKASKAHIRYSEVDGDWRYAKLDTENDGVEEIGDLKNGVHYWFQVAQVNGCAVGDYSRSFDPVP